MRVRPATPWLISVAVANGHFENGSSDRRLGVAVGCQLHRNTAERAVELLARRTNLDLVQAINAKAVTVRAGVRIAFLHRLHADWTGCILVALVWLLHHARRRVLG